LLHSSIGVIAIVTWLSHPDVSNLIRYASIALAVIVSADLLRFEVAAFERVYERWLGYFMVRG
jgi:diacylglycerol kinase (CTP)